MPCLTVDTPTGPLLLEEADGAITRVSWKDAPSRPTPLLMRAAEQIRAYFAGELQEFDLPLRIETSKFQARACQRMAQIPFGDTITYGDLARDLEVSPQAAGQACGGNPIPIIVPCHRVLGAQGLGGFSGGVGVETKVWLVKHEGAAGLLI